MLLLCPVEHWKLDDKYWTPLSYLKNTLRWCEDNFKFNVIFQWKILFQLSICRNWYQFQTRIFIPIKNHSIPNLFYSNLITYRLKNRTIAHSWKTKQQWHSFFIIRFIVNKTIDVVCESDISLIVRKTQLICQHNRMTAHCSRFMLICQSDTKTLIELKYNTMEWSSL